jgi:two-component system, OmpR family, phosphate regulon sensor histidine kinase PhoR
MIEGVLLLDEKGHVQLANNQFKTLFGITAEVEGKSILEVCRQQELASFIDLVGIKRQVFDHEIKLGRMPERWLQVNAAGIFDTDARKHGTIIVVHDLTRLKQLERTREEFVANVSHELRTPLSLIKGGVETLLDGARHDPDARLKFLRTIQRNSDRLQFLIEDLLTISELESGRVKLNLAPVPLRALVETVLEHSQNQAASRSTALLNDVPDLTVQADAARLEQVLGNLVDNAIKYGKQQGCVTVAARHTGEAVEVTVTDDGSGIPPESLERIFERFFRVDKGRSRETGGTGLGLAIVKHIVQSHGGKVSVKSKPGSGSTFTLSIPDQATLD